MTQAPRPVDVLVIGGGQAGLAAGYYLRRAQADFVILDSREGAPAYCCLGAARSWWKPTAVPGLVAWTITEYTSSPCSAVGVTMTWKSRWRPGTHGKR